MYLTFEGEPNWQQIAPDLAARLASRGAALGGTTTAAEEAALVGVGSRASLAGAAIPAAFVAGAALTLYASYRSVQEIQHLKDLRRTADSAVDDFITGFLTAIGIQGWGGGSAATAAGKEGQRHGNVWIHSMLAKWRKWEQDPRFQANWKARKLGPCPQLSDDEIIASWKQGWGTSEQQASHAYRMVKEAYNLAIRRQVYDAFIDTYGSEVYSEGRTMSARADAGLPISGDLPDDQPDYGYLDNIFAGAAPSQPPP